jgi:hypothetical protein
MKNDRQWLQVDKIFQSSIQYGHTQRAKHWVENPFRGNADEVVFKGWQKIKRETTKIKRNLSKKSNEANIGLWLVIEFLPVLWWWQRTTWKREDNRRALATKPATKAHGRSPRRAGADASNSDNSSIHCDEDVEEDMTSALCSNPHSFSSAWLLSLIRCAQQPMKTWSPNPRRASAYGTERAPTGPNAAPDVTAPQQLFQQPAMTQHHSPAPISCFWRAVCQPSPSKFPSWTTCHSASTPPSSNQTHPPPHQVVLPHYSTGGPAPLLLRPQRRRKVWRS